MNKTALQQLMDKWKVEGEKIELMTFRGAIRDAEEFLETEKQQIIDAHNSAGGGDDCFNGKDYFEKNFF